MLDDGACRYGQPSTVVHATAGGLSCLREGVVSQSALERLSSMIILMVCTGNTCRSPMAEVLMRRLVAEKLGCRVEELDQRGVLIASAGIAARTGSGPARSRGRDGRKITLPGQPRRSPRRAAID